MDTALPQKFPFILGRNLAKANCTHKKNQVCTSCDIVVLGRYIYFKGTLHRIQNYQEIRGTYNYKPESKKIYQPKDRNASLQRL